MTTDMQSFSSTLQVPVQMQSMLFSLTATQYYWLFLHQNSNYIETFREVNIIQFWLFV